VQVDAAGRVLVGGTPCGVTATNAPASATLAAWATAIHVVAPDAGALRATVERVAQGPGRWEITLAGSERLHSHLPIDERPPRPGEEVGICINPQRTVVIPAAR
jgi:hypothetical protein